jgi:hypothetical protein
MATEAQLQKLIDKISADSKRAYQMAAELYGPDAQVFVESEGGIHVMDGDDLYDRQRFVRLTSKGIHKFGMGAW